MSSPTQRSLKKLQAEGYVCQVVERWNSFARRRIDLFGFIDIVAIHPEKIIILGVQTTAASSLSARLKKISAEPKSITWLSAGGKIEVHGWKKAGKRHEKRGKWICDVRKYPQL